MKFWVHFLLRNYKSYNYPSCAFCHYVAECMVNQNRHLQQYQPRELTTEIKLTIQLHAWVPFGAYCEIHDETSHTNSMTAETGPVISLGICSNFQGSVYFYCVNNGKVVKQWYFTEVPVPDSVIWRIESAATKENMNTGIEFDNHDLQPIKVDKDDDGIWKPWVPTEISC